MNKKIIIITAIIILLLGGIGFYIWKKKSAVELPVGETNTGGGIIAPSTIDKAALSAQLDKLNKELASENYELFNAQRYASLNPGSLDANTVLSKKQAIVNETQNAINTIKTQLNA